MNVTYDAGALIAVDRDDPLMFARHRQAVSRGLVPVVPAPVIWQVWRDGSEQARLARFLRAAGSNQSMTTWPVMLGYSSAGLG